MNRQERRRPWRIAGLGAGVLLIALSATAFPGPAVAALLAMLALPGAGWVARRRAATRRLAVRSGAAPAVLDLLGAALLAGLNPHKAVLRVAERAPEALQEDLGLAAAVLRLGGTPAEALAARAEALRSRTRLHAEAEAGRAAVRLVFPLVLCFLPAFVLLVVVPTVIGALRTLTP
jgi:Flp pilus assembly protein TadB